MVTVVPFVIILIASIIFFRNPSLVQYLPPGHVIGKPEPLFSKIEPELLEKLRAKYAGTQSDRAKVYKN